MSLRSVNVLRGAIVALLCSSVPSQAQVPAASAVSCKALVDWIVILEREMAPVNLMTMMLDRVGLHATNLFRDEHFRPMYGKRISETTFTEMQNFFLGMFPMCGQHLSGEDLARFQRMNILVSPPFRSLNGPFSFSDVVAGVAEREQIVAWMRTQTTLQTGTTPEAFDDLERKMARARIDLQKLWPREQKGFIETLAARQRDVARTIVQSAAASSSQYAARGLEGVRAIAGLRSSHERYLTVLDSEARSQFDHRLDDNIAVALRSVASTERFKLSSMPAGLDGALAIVAWRTAVDTQVSGLPPSADIAALFVESRQLQQKRLAEGKSEFKQIVAQHPQPARDGLNAAQLVDRLFLDASSKSLPEYEEYRSVLTAHMQAQAAPSPRGSGPTAATSAPSPARPSDVDGSSFLSDAQIATLKTLANTSPIERFLGIGIWHNGVEHLSIVSARVILAFRFRKGGGAPATPVPDIVDVDCGGEAGGRVFECVDFRVVVNGREVFPWDADSRVETYRTGSGEQAKRRAVTASYDARELIRGFTIFYLSPDKVEHVHQVSALQAERDLLLKLEPETAR